MTQALSDIAAHPPALQMPYCSLLSAAVSMRGSTIGLDGTPSPRISARSSTGLRPALSRAVPPHLGIIFCLRGGKVMLAWYRMTSGQRALSGVSQYWAGMLTPSDYRYWRQRAAPMRLQGLNLYQRLNLAWWEYGGYAPSTEWDGGRASWTPVITSKIAYYNTGTYDALLEVVMADQPPLPNGYYGASVYWRGINQLQYQIAQTRNFFFGVNSGGIEPLSASVWIVPLSVNQLRGQKIVLDIPITPY